MAEKVSTPPTTAAPPTSGAPAGPESDKAGEKSQPDGAKSAATKGDPPKTGTPGPDSAKPSEPRSGEKKAGGSPPKSGSQQPEPTKADSQQPPPAKTDAKHPSPPKSEAANVKTDPQTNVPPQTVSGKLSPTRPDQPIPPADAAKPGGGVPESPRAATAIVELSPPNLQQMQPGPDFHSSNPAESGIVGDKFCFFGVMSIILAIPIIAIPLLLISKGSDWNVSMSTDQTSPAVVVRINLSSTKLVHRRTSAARIGIEQAGTSTTQMFGQPRKEQDVVCHSTHCLALASLLQSRLNRTVDPCADFYGYVCGSGHGNASSAASKALHGANHRSTLGESLKGVGDWRHRGNSSAKRALRGRLEMALRRSTPVNRRWVSVIFGATADSSHSTNDFVKKHTRKPLVEQANQAMRRAAHWGRNLYASCLNFSQRAEQELDVIREFMASLKLDLGDVSEDPHEDPLDRMLQLSLVYAFPVIISLAVETMVHVEGKSILQASQAT
ncbi:hypothetical protein HPB49_012506 [Dermacentor silvarum]|uniref:Uncharacterized protein n=1 Tax=Dermacentor silvarum TaxID=543639 RepID=A0ACB8CL37_DERSI|nr:hypothetical protein HPB49_012506 [Dermacentor silvarum]